MKQTAHHKEFEKIIRDMSYRHQLWRVFSDFCEATAIALSQVTGFNQEQEDRYLKIMEAYDENERLGFGKLLGVTVKGLEDLDCDFLGEMFMSLELGSHWHGQFFTPFHLSLMMGKMVLDGLKPMIEEKGFVTVQEPASGAGGMILGLAAAMRDEGINYQKHMHVTAIDTDSTAANMCYIQLTLHHIPATVYTGNTLSMEMRSVRYTLAHYTGFWSQKLERQSATSEPVPVIAVEPTPKPADIIMPDCGQYGLFELKEAA